jgi:hypothetical protein
MKKIKYLFVAGLFCLVSCTDLTETLYDTIASENYYNTKDDIIRAVFRPYEHAYWSVSRIYDIQENAADQIATYNREGDWLDGQLYHRQHYHTWTIDDSAPYNSWFAMFQGVMLCSASRDDLQKLNPAEFGFTAAEFGDFEANLRTMRAWMYINLLDLFRNIPLAVSLDVEKNTQGQVSPQEMFNFIEYELTESIALLPRKESAGGNQLKQGLWNQAGAAALLVKLYLNAEKWIGTPKYTECAQYAQKIIDGEYGHYEIAERWDAPFDWNNETCDEVIFAFTGTLNRAHWQYSNEMYWWSIPARSPDYFGFKDWGMSNPKFALQPSRDTDGNLYHFELGMPVAKFQKYPEDCRLKLYKNLEGISQREGMFLYGYLEYEENGEMKKVKNPGQSYDLYIRDQVGLFRGADPTTTIEDKESNMNHGDHNSGWHLVKYPVYRSGDPGAMEADYALIRLAEVYYSLAECKFRAGDTEGAGILLNQVRKRYYPQEKYAEYLYAPEGIVTLTANELLNEWGREFIGEGRRRTDLIRWNKFCSGTWWDKQPDPDNHTEILPLHRSTLGANPHLVQNPGYDDMEDDNT